MIHISTLIVIVTLAITQRSVTYKPQPVPGNHIFVQDLNGHDSHATLMRI